MEIRQISRNGNSLVIVLPRPVLKMLRWKHRDHVIFEAHRDHIRLYGLEEYQAAREKAKHGKQ